MGGAGLMAARPDPVPLLDPGFPHLKSRVIERTGHFYYQDKDDLLWERVRKRLRATGLSDSSAYLTLLDDPISGPAEWGKLEAEITIGETFFFRYAEQFAALRETILPEIIARRASTRRLRIWSAGCSTGAEPYSLAILANEILGESLGAWRVSILGTDINDSVLKSARQARFGKWALRSMPDEQRDRYFVNTGKEQWEVRREFRSLVRFERHNLLSLLDGTSPLEIADFDLILCRNVLIYFHPDTVTQIVGALRDRLDDDGWMLLGHAEPNPVFSTMMQTLNLPGTVAYRRGAVTAPAPAPQQLKTTLQDWKPLLPELRPAAPVQGSTRLRPAKAGRQASSPPAPQATSGLLGDIRARANAGDFTAGADLCRKALVTEPLNAALHFYQGLILRALGRPDEAEKSFLKSLYLDKNFAMAHYHLGLLLLAAGRPVPGRRSLTHAAQSVATLADDHPLDEGDGVTARELRELVRIHLDIATPSKRRA
ncbi:MAG: protein-glutamate methyltransferase [Microvirga sp.]|jgi:chemotaxis protein methyltransferase CheR|nr:protein-glutamate methyltransferase [Microvirga sp.]